MLITPASGPRQDNECEKALWSQSCRPPQSHRVCTNVSSCLGSPRKPSASISGLSYDWWPEWRMWTQACTFLFLLFSLQHPGKTPPKEWPSPWRTLLRSGWEGLSSFNFWALVDWSWWPLFLLAPDSVWVTDITLVPMVHRINGVEGTQVIIQNPTSPDARIHSSLTAACWPQKSSRGWEGAPGPQPRVDLHPPGRQLILSPAPEAVNQMLLDWPSHLSHGFWSLSFGACSLGAPQLLKDLLKVLTDTAYNAPGLPWHSRTEKCLRAPIQLLSFSLQREFAQGTNTVAFIFFAEGVKFLLPLMSSYWSWLLFPEHQGLYWRRSSHQDALLRAPIQLLSFSLQRELNFCCH